MLHTSTSARNRGVRFRAVKVGMWLLGWGGGVDSGLMGVDSVLQNAEFKNEGKVYVALSLWQFQFLIS